MDNKAFNYSVIRFLPEKTIGEFINIGVIIKCCETGFLGYKIQPWTQRASQFFKNVDRGFYTYATKALQDEVENIKRLVFKQNNDIPLLKNDLNMIFGSIVKTYDTAIQFSPVFSGLTTDLDSELEYLHQKYVLAHIEEPVRTDKVSGYRVERSVKDILRREQLTDSFKEMELKCSYFSHKFPLTHKNGGDPYILQPLSLDIEDEKAINDTAHKWFGRIEDLKSENAFTITMIIAPPRQGKFKNHFDHAIKILGNNTDNIVLLPDIEDFGKKLRNDIKISSH